MTRGLKTVYIPDTVTSISDSAFSGCKFLKAIKLPPSIKSIGGVAFSGCEALEEVIVADGIKIKFSFDTAFDRCPNLTIKGKKDKRSNEAKAAQPYFNKSEGS